MNLKSYESIKSGGIKASLYLHIPDDWEDDHMSYPRFNLSKTFLNALISKCPYLKIINITGDFNYFVLIVSQNGAVNHRNVYYSLTDDLYKRVFAIRRGRDTTQFVQFLRDGGIVKFVQERFNFKTQPISLDLTRWDIREYLT